MKVKIWGARGSIPAPLTPNQVREKMIQVLKGAVDVDLTSQDSIQAYLDHLSPLLAGTAGGNTSCLEIQAEGQTIIIDAGSGIRALGEELMKGPCGRGEGLIHLFLSHNHWDHIQGLPFFLPAFVSGNRIVIYSVHDSEQALINQMDPATFPVTFDYLRSRATIEFVRLREYERMRLGNIRISNLKLHHPGDAYTFRFEYDASSFVYASDGEYKQLDDENIKRYIKFYSGADLLIFDAQFSLRESILKEDWGHSSALIGADLARRAGVKRLVLFHHDPSTTDTELLKILAQAEDYQDSFHDKNSCEIFIGREGQVFDLQRYRKFSLQWQEDRETAILVISEEFDQPEIVMVLNEIGIISEVDETLDKDMRFPKLVVDLSGMEHISIPCLRALIDLRRYWAGSPFVLAGASQRIWRVINLANYGDVFAFYPSVSEALDALDARYSLRLQGHKLKDRYTLEETLGEGPLSVIFRASDSRLKRSVAIKIFSPSLSKRTIRHLLQRAREMARLDAANIVRIFDWDFDQELAYLVMEFAGGSNLRQNLAQLNRKQVFAVLFSILDALHDAHSQGLVHGNLKPENVILTDKQVKLMDFGMQWSDPGRPISQNPVIMGDPRYLAPEQIAGQEADPRTDLYTFGMLLYEIFTGQHPFAGEDSEHIMLKQMEQDPAPPRQLNPKMPAPLEKLIMALLQKEMADRPASADQVRRLLADLMEISWPKDTVPTEGAGTPGAVPVTAIPTTPGSNGLADIEHLLTLWAQARQGKGQVVVMKGNIPDARSHVLRPFASQIRNGTVIFGHGREGNGEYHQVFVQILREYLSRTYPFDQREVLGDAAPVLATLAPGIHKLVPDIPKLDPADDSQHQPQLWRSFMEFLGRAARKRPWLMILEDLHLADAASLEMFKYLAYNVSDIPVMIICLYETNELDGGHPLRRLERTLSRYSMYHQLQI